MSTTRRGTVVRLPQLGESVTEGMIGAWLRQVGDQIEKYDPLVEITTDKVNAEIPSPVGGVLVEIVAQEGETLPVGAEICVIDEGKAADTPQQPDGSRHSDHLPASSTTAHDDRSVRERARRLGGTEGEMELLRVRSSPAVRRIAEEHGIDIGRLTGTGTGGRVTKQDILRYLEEHQEPVEQAAQAPSPTEEPAEEAIEAAEAAIQETVSPPEPRESVVEAAAPPLRKIPVHDGDQIVPITPMRRQIAEHMVRSERTAPHVTVWMEVDMSRVVEVRNRARDRFAKEEDFDLTYLPFVVKAVVHALRDHPQVNAVWDEDRIIRRRAINIGVAIGMEEGLVVPVIKQADGQSIAGLARAIHDRASRARANKLTLDDVQGGTFTVNNPGTFGTIMSTPIIVQPQAAILSTEAIVKRPIVVDDTIAIRPIMNLSLSIDHRVLDGLMAARFLSTVRQWLEGVSPDLSIY